MTKKEAQNALKSAASAAAEAVALIRAADEQVQRFRVRLGIAYADAADVIAAFPAVYPDGWKAWAEARMPGGPDVYRLLHAGRVALVLGPEAVGEAGERSLVPLYRILKAAEKGTEKDREKAEQKVRDLWARLTSKRQPTDPYPSEEVVLKAVDRATGSSGGTRGPKAPSSKKRSTRKSRGKKQTAPAKVQEIAPEAVGRELSEAEQKSLGGAIGRAFRTINPEDLGTAQTFALVMVRACRSYGSDAVEAAIRSHVKATKKATK